MRRHLAYLSYLVCHRWFVMLECWRVGLIWRGLVHDLSKFLPSEFGPYAFHFHNVDGTPRQRLVDDPAFDRAWFLHASRNRHHWEWWVMPGHDGTHYAHAMTERDTLEMVCDWHGAARAKGVHDAPGDRLSVFDWWRGHRGKMHLHPATEYTVQQRLIERRKP